MTKQRLDIELTKRGLTPTRSQAESWIKTLLQDALPAQTYGRLLLSPGAAPPVALQSRGKQVCTCFNVTDLRIAAHLSRSAGTDGERLASLQSTLHCGTNCGSCTPELKRLVRMSAPVAEPG